MHNARFVAAAGESSNTAGTSFGSLNRLSSGRGTAVADAALSSGRGTAAVADAAGITGSSGAVYFVPRRWQALRCHLQHGAHGSQICTNGSQAIIFCLVCNPTIF